MVLQYGDSGRSFPKDSIFACTHKVSGGQEQEQVSVEMEFTVQVSTYFELNLNRSCYGIGR